MQNLTLQEVGEVIRKVRKDRGLRLEDLADENISPATVSNIERGIAHVSPEKVSYLLKKLNLSERNLPEIIVQEQQDRGRLEFCFLTINTLNQIGLIDEALTRLDELKLNEKHPMIAQVHYLKGQSLFYQEKWKQAERAFFHALRFSQHASKGTNLEAACYLYLGHVSFKQNKLEQALRYTEQGINVFIENKDKKHIKYQLYLNKIKYLKKNQRITEGLRLIQVLWDEIHSINNIEITIHFYILRVDFCKQAGLYEEAIYYATLGIELAQRNKKFVQMFDLWFALGNIYMKLKDWIKAKSCFQMAIKRKNQFPDHQKLSSIYQKLGLLYIKQNQTKNAHPALLHALDHAQKTTNPDQICDCLLLMTHLCFSVGKADEALSHCKAGLAIAAEQKLTNQEHQFWLLLAKYWEDKNEIEFQNCMKNIYHLQKKQINFTTDFLN